MSDNEDEVHVECFDVGLDLDAPLLTERVAAKLRAAAAEIESYFRMGFKIHSVEIRNSRTSVGMVRSMPEGQMGLPPEVKHKLDIPIISNHEHHQSEGVRVSVATRNFLKRRGILKARDLVVSTERDFSEIGGVGPKTVAEVKAALEILGLHLGMKVD